ncbi:hypothetical protein GCM10010199_47420 [Dactylosporangium roseum]
MSGSATVTTVVSTINMNDPRQTATRGHHFRIFRFLPPDRGFSIGGTGLEIQSAAILRRIPASFLVPAPKSGKLADGSGPDRTFSVSCPARRMLPVRSNDDAASRRDEPWC